MADPVQAPPIPPDSPPREQPLSGEQRALYSALALLNMRTTGFLVQWGVARRAPEGGYNRHATLVEFSGISMAHDAYREAVADLVSNPDTHPRLRSIAVKSFNLAKQLRAACVPSHVGVPRPQFHYPPGCNPARPSQYLKHVL